MRDTIDMAREAGAHPSHNPELWDIWEVSNEALNRLVALVRADERSDAEGRFNALLDDYRTALETIGDMRLEDEVNGNIIECHEATIKRLEAKILAEREALIGLLKGIDETETESAEGWWETSAGAEFGAGILAAIRARWQA